MMNTRQVIWPIDDSLKSFIIEAITVALASTMAVVNKTIEDQVNKSIAAMNSSVNEVCVRQDFLNSEIQMLLGETSTSYVTYRNNNPRMSQMTKIKFRKFYGDDPTGWVYRCNQLFKVDKFSRVNVENVTCEVYVKALLKRFFSTYEDPMSKLKNIRQKDGLVQVYIDAFDLLMTKVEVPETQAISFFLGGLDKEIEMSVRMFRPQTLVDACLSKLQVANNNVSKRFTKALLTTPRYTQAHTDNFDKNNSPQVLIVNQSYNMKKHRYVLGHKCSGKLFSLEIVKEIEELENESELQCDVFKKF
ncbi:putative nucleotidyltransferase, ribonuclease H [Tanacetum coccineum]